MYRKKWRSIAAFILTVILLFSMNPDALAADRRYPEQPVENTVVFPDLSTLHAGESIQRTVLDAEGNEAVIGIRKVEESNTDSERMRTASAGETWQVWYSGLTIRAEFYMTVSNNRVTSVYDDMITVIGGSYSNVRLTSTSTYGKLSFSVTGIIGLTTTSCWLKGTVTGEDDQIEVTWQM